MEPYQKGPPERPRTPLPVVVVVLGLAAFGAIALVQWAVGWLFGLAKLGIVAVIVLAVLALLVRGGPPDD